MASSPVLEILQRGDRTDLSGNRLTSYGFRFGGGSILYWNGQWVGIGHPPISHNDLEAHLTTPDGKPVNDQLTSLLWRPDRLTMWRSTAGPVEVIEEKAICDDVFVNRIEFSYGNNSSRQRRPVDLRLQLWGEGRFEPKLHWRDGHLHIHETRTNTHRVIGLGLGREILDPSLDSALFRFATAVHFEGFGDEATHEEIENVWLILSAGDSYDEALEKFRRVAPDPAQALAQRTAEWEAYFRDRVPEFDCDDRLIRKLAYHCFYVPFANLYDFKGRGFYQHPFSSLSKFRLMPSWYWDTCFHAMYEKYLNGGPLPKGTIHNLIRYDQAVEMKDKVHQVVVGAEGEFRTPVDGMLPFTVCIDSFIFGRLVDPHILPVAIWDIYLKDNDESFPLEMLDPLVKYDDYLAKNRDEAKQDLMNVIHQGETGWDNSKRWMLNSILKYPSSPVTTEGKKMQPPDFNAYFYLSRLFVAKLARMAGRADVDSQFQDKAARTRQSIDSLWDDDLGLYVDRFEATQETTKIKSPGGIIPMIANIPSKEQAERLVAHLTNPKEFWTAQPAPSLSLDDPDFRPEDEYQSYWNGRMWPNVNWVLIEGLCRYGYWEIARELALRTIGGAIATGEPTCRENYYSHTGGHPRKQGHNTFNYGWGGIHADIVIRRLLGLQARAPKDELYLDPLFPKAWRHASISQVKVGPHEIGWHLVREGGTLHGRLSHKGPRPLKVVSPAGIHSVHNGDLPLDLSGERHLSGHWLDWLEE